MRVLARAATSVASNAPTGVEALGATRRQQAGVRAKPEAAARMLNATGDSSGSEFSLFAAKRKEDDAMASAQGVIFGAVLGALLWVMIGATAVAVLNAFPG